VVFTARLSGRQAPPVCESTEGEITRAFRQKGEEKGNLPGVSSISAPISSFMSRSSGRARNSGRRAENRVSVGHHIRLYR
jgi:hypothetical protein